MGVGGGDHWNRWEEGIDGRDWIVRFVGREEDMAEGGGEDCVGVEWGVWVGLVGGRGLGEIAGMDWREGLDWVVVGESGETGGCGGVKVAGEAGEAGEAGKGIVVRFIDLALAICLLCLVRWCGDVVFILYLLRVSMLSGLCVV